jgi:hypothetical protein
MGLLRFTLLAFSCRSAAGSQDLLRKKSVVPGNDQMPLVKEETTQNLRTRSPEIDNKEDMFGPYMDVFVEEAMSLPTDPPSALNQSPSTNPTTAHSEAPSKSPSATPNADTSGRPSKSLIKSGTIQQASTKQWSRSSLFLSSTGNVSLLPMYPLALSYTKLHIVYVSPNSWKSIICSDEFTIVCSDEVAFVSSDSRNYRPSKLVSIIITDSGFIVKTDSGPIVKTDKGLIISSNDFGFDGSPDSRNDTTA